MRAHASLIILASSLLYAAPAAAQEIRVSETKLAFQLPRTETQQRSFRVDAKPLPVLEVVVAGDLVEPGSGLVILGANVEVASRERNAEQGFEVFTVTIGGATRTGHYVGRLDVRPGQGAGREIDLDVTVLPAFAQVDAEVNSKSPVLAARQGWLDLPFVGSPSPCAEVSAKLPIYFIDPTGGEAFVEHARALGLLAAGGGALPGGAVRIVSETPLSVSGGNGKPLEVGVAPTNLDAGEYKGTLEIRVRNQETLLQLPLTARIKHGPLVPLLALVLGILAALLFTWWNADGKVTHDLVKSLTALEAEVRAGRKLQAEDREKASRLIEEAMQAIEARAPFTEIKAKADTAQKHAADRRAAADQLLEALQPLREKAEARVEDQVPGVRLRQELTEGLDTVETNVREGRYTRLKDAEDRLAELRPRIETFAAIVDKLREVPADRRAEVVRQMDEADTLAALRQVLLDAGVPQVPSPGPGQSFGLHRVDRLEAAPILPQLALSRRLQLSLGAAAVALITYLFVLAIGFLSLYVQNDTFGADPMSYVSLFLWGATVEAVRGKTVTLTSLKMIGEGR